MKLRSIIFTILLFQVGQVAAQDLLRSDSPPSPDSLLERFTPEELIAEVQRRQSQGQSYQNNLSADEIDNLVLSILYQQTQQEPRFVQARLDLSDSQLEAFNEILNSLNEASLQHVAGNIQSMCSRWKASVRSGNEKVLDSLDAYEANENSTKQALSNVYQEAISEIEAMLGIANWVVFNDYMNDERQTLVGARVTSFKDNIQAFGTEEETLEYHCGDQY